MEASLSLPTLRDLDDLKLNREEDSREVYERSELVLLPLDRVGRRLPRVERPRIGIIVVCLIKVVDLLDFSVFHLNNKDAPGFDASTTIIIRILVCFSSLQITLG